MSQIELPQQPVENNRERPLIFMNFKSINREEMLKGFNKEDLEWVMDKYVKSISFGVKYLE